MVDLDIIDELLIRYSVFFHRMLIVLECRSKSSIYTLQDSLGESKTLKLFLILSSSSPCTTKAFLLVAFLRTRNHDVTERVAKVDRQGIQSYI